MMSRLLQSASHKHGLAPGAVVYVGDESSARPAHLHCIQFNEQTLREKTLDSLDGLALGTDGKETAWMEVHGLRDTALIERIGKHFNLHPLVLEDIVNTGQRPKMEDYGDYLFLVVKSLSWNAANSEIEPEQISVILGRHFILTFHERHEDIFDPVRERLRHSTVRIRKMGADYLAYALLDIVIDHYFFMLERLGDNLEQLEEDVLKTPGPALLQSLHAAKRQLILVRKNTWPLREMINELLHSESPLFMGATRDFLRDLYDHTIQVLETTESFRDVAAGLQDIFLSSVSNRMNEVMKTLTIIATIFIPLSFLVGVYGMNFKNMPELGWNHSYLAFWVVIALIVMGMMKWFKKKGWL